MWTLTTHGKYSVDGDEPHYLIVTESLLTDGDLDPGNNYAQDDGRLFGHAGLMNDGHALVNRAGRLESVHEVGLSALLLPPYAAATLLARHVPDDVLRRFRMNRGLFTYSLVSLGMTALTSIACAWLFRALVVFAAPWEARAAVGLMALSPPVLGHAFLLFPESIALAVVCLAISVGVRRPSDTASFARLLLAFVLFGLLPSLHRKFTVLALGLSVSIVWLRRADLRGLSPARRGALVLAFVLPQLCFYAWTLVRWGSLLGPQFALRNRLMPGNLPIGALGLLADREYGVMAYAPLLAVVPACLWLARARLWPLYVPAAALFLVMSAFDEWWGGFAPAGRYLVPIMPVMAAAAAGALGSRRVRLVGGVLALFQAGINVMLWNRPRLLWPQNEGTNRVLERIPYAGPAFERLLPPVRAGADTAAVVLFLSVIIGLTWWLVAGNRAGARSRRPGGSPIAGRNFVR